MILATAPGCIVKHPLTRNLLPTQVLSMLILHILSKNLSWNAMSGQTFNRSIVLFGLIKDSNQFHALLSFDPEHSQATLHLNPGFPP